MPEKLHAFLFILSLVLPTIGMDAWRIYVFAKDTNNQTACELIHDLEADLSEKDCSEPAESSSKSGQQSTDLIETEPEYFVDHATWIKFQAFYFLHNFSGHFHWQNVILESTYPPPELS